MSTVTLQELERDPLALLRRVEAGEALVVIRDDQPIAEMRPITPPCALPRPYGLAAGEFVVPDDFDEPLVESVFQ